LYSDSPCCKISEKSNASSADVVRPATAK
jgi:hypothetical protein